MNEKKAIEQKWQRVKGTRKQISERSNDIQYRRVERRQVGQSRRSKRQRMKERRRYVRKYGGEVEVARGMRKSISKEVRVSK